MLLKTMRLFAKLDQASPSQQVINSYRNAYEKILREEGITDLSRFPNGEYLDEELEKRWKEYHATQRQNDLSL